MHLQLEMAVIVAENNLKKAKKCSDPIEEKRILENVFADLAWIAQQTKQIGANKNE